MDLSRYRGVVLVDRMCAAGKRYRRVSSITGKA
jgi:hypothetical protein